MVPASVTLGRRVQMMVADMLEPFDYILPEALDAGVATCFENGTMYCMRAPLPCQAAFLQLVPDGKSTSPNSASDPMMTMFSPKRVW